MGFCTSTHTDVNTTIGDHDSCHEHRFDNGRHARHTIIWFVMGTYCLNYHSADLQLGHIQSGYMAYKLRSCCIAQHRSRGCHIAIAFQNILDEEAVLVASSRKFYYRGNGNNQHHDYSTENVKDIPQQSLVAKWPTAIAA